MRIEAEILKIARELVSMDDPRFVADQLNNAWEYMSEREMVRNLVSQTGYDERKLARLVDKWYGDVGLRMEMELAPLSKWNAWLRKELR